MTKNTKNNSDENVNGFGMIVFTVFVLIATMIWMITGPNIICNSPF